jgi:hypothetical protein
MAWVIRSHDNAQYAGEKVWGLTGWEVSLGTLVKSYAPQRSILQD